ncbi:MAG: hypothetical protein ACI865_002083 [Flavobacteriaceae bacterium]|jgi:hypothetical protein
MEIKAAVFWKASLLFQEGLKILFFNISQSLFGLTEVLEKKLEVELIKDLDEYL